MKPITIALLLCFTLHCAGKIASAELQAGAAVVDVTPIRFPVLVNGGMTSRIATKVTTTVNARAIVLDDGRERLGIVVVDSCMMPRPLLDDAKLLASQRTKIKPDHILISATHTHTAPASMGCLGTNADPTYVPYLREKLAEALAAAEANLEPARAGWGVKNARDFTALRRWIFRPDRVAEDPFGNPTVRANMHAGRNWEDVTGESGPADPDLSLLSIQASDGRPIAVLANFSMHYFSGQREISADYFGLFCEGLKKRLAKDDDKHPPFVGIMSHGCSGDIWRRDYKQPEPRAADSISIEDYTAGLLDIAAAAYESIDYRGDADLAMAESRLKLNYRVPDRQRLEWAERIVDELGDRPPKTREEVYAREQIILHQRQSTEVVVQALRIGDIAITTTPNETYALTGLKLKLQSPLRKTMVIELANGGDGYIPPPEQHVLGGYNTWAARSAGLEIEAEPKIAEAALLLLEKVCGSSRVEPRLGHGPGRKAIVASKPLALWRLDEMAGPRAVDSSGNNRDAFYEAGVVFFLEGAGAEEFEAPADKNRAAHFAGGRLRARLAGLKDRYSISLWFWNGMPDDARGVTGWMLSRGRDYGLGPGGEHLGIGGTGGARGKLIYLYGGSEEGGEEDKEPAKPASGSTAIERWTWNHLALVRDGKSLRVYLNGKPEIETELPEGSGAALDQWFFGGRCDRQDNWEGRLDEIAVFDRALTAEEIEGLAGE